MFRMCCDFGGVVGGQTEAMPVNKALYAGAIEGTIRPDGSSRWFEANVVVMTRCYPAHTGNEVSSCVGGVAEWP